MSREGDCVRYYVPRKKYFASILTSNGWDYVMKLYLIFEVTKTSEFFTKNQERNGIILVFEWYIPSISCWYKNISAQNTTNMSSHSIKSNYVSNTYYVRITHIGCSTFVIYCYKLVITASTTFVCRCDIFMTTIKTCLSAVYKLRYIVNFITPLPIWCYMGSIDLPWSVWIGRTE